jgi:hypothetical protein
MLLATKPTKTAFDYARECSRQEINLLLDKLQDVSWCGECPSPIDSRKNNTAREIIRRIRYLVEDLLS